MSTSPNAAVISRFQCSLVLCVGLSAFPNLGCLPTSTAPDGGAVDAGAGLDCYAPAWGVCEESELTLRWQRFENDSANRRCDDDNDCVLLLPQSLYPCGCDDGDAIWGKDGLAINTSAAAAALAINARYLAPECSQYREFCANRVCDGWAPFAAHCSNGGFCRITNPPNYCFACGSPGCDLDDAGEPLDAGHLDAGALLDAGHPNAGGDDAGQPDAGQRDAN